MQPLLTGGVFSKLFIYYLHVYIILFAVDHFGTNKYLTLISLLQITLAVPGQPPRPQSAPAPGEQNILTQAFAQASGPTPPAAEQRPFRTSLTLGDELQTSIRSEDLQASITSQDLRDFTTPSQPASQPASQHSTSRPASTAASTHDPDSDD